VRLNDLRGCTFRVGGAVLCGMGLCLPCGHLERLTDPGACAALQGRGGLRAEILMEGVIRLNDPLEVLSAAPAAAQLPSRGRP
jgi:MOSC domain-containing protein YiiM